MAKSKPKLNIATKSDKPLSEIKSDTALQGEDYYEMVSEAAYYRAEKRGFAPGCEIEDWIEAEAEIQAMQNESLVA